MDYEIYKKLNSLNNQMLILNASCDSLNTIKEYLVDENNNRIKIEINDNDEKDNLQNDKSIDKLQCDKLDHKLDDKKKIKEQVNDVLCLMINKSDCSFFCNKVNQLIQDNNLFKNKIKRLKFDISNEKRKSIIRKNGRANGKTNGAIEFEFSDNLDKQKPLNRHLRHTINVVHSRPAYSFKSSKIANQLNAPCKTLNKYGSSIALNVFEIPTQKGILNFFI